MYEGVMVMSKQRKEKMEFSKKLAIYVLVVYAVTIIGSLFVMYISQDASGVEWIIGSSGAALTATLTLYYTKSKRENELKIRKAALKAGVNLGRDEMGFSQQAVDDEEDEVTDDERF